MNFEANSYATDSFCEKWAKAANGIGVEIDITFWNLRIKSVQAGTYKPQQWRIEGRDTAVKFSIF